ncbi:hypothetical protein [Sphingobacterium spiritivorum]|uniref:hypothetical protein n=1 Tax=Sphingobacterium spiritivorum TaxID=258 RepID=UPI003DA2BF05
MDTIIITTHFSESVMNAVRYGAGLVVVSATGKGGLEKLLLVFACDLKEVNRSTPVSEIGWWLNGGYVVSA